MLEGTAFISYKYQLTLVDPRDVASLPIDHRVVHTAGRGT